MDGIPYTYLDTATGPCWSKLFSPAGGHCCDSFVILEGKQTFMVADNGLFPATEVCKSVAMMIGIEGKVNKSSGRDQPDRG